MRKDMSKMNAVQFDHYGDIDVLEVRQVPRPSVGSAEVLVQVKAAGINPGEASIRKGLLHSRWPATFPSGEGSDLAGIIVEVGSGVKGLKPGDEVLGFTDKRSSHAEFAVVPAAHLTLKPAAVPWEVAGALFVVGTTAYAAVRAVDLSARDVLAVAGAAGGVGSLAVQLAKRTGATVIGIAGPGNDAWLTGKGVIPVNHGKDLARRLTAASPSRRIDAFLDFFGGGYVELALKELNISAQRVNTIIDFTAVEKFRVKSAGSADAANVGVLAELADLIARGELEVPVAKVYPLAAVREAYRDLEERHTRGKIVLKP
jgi:NADPH:quinone reductase-like Zn-dependent oxidoreductase